MPETKLLKPTGQDQIERIFSGLEQTVQRGAIAIFSFAASGRVSILCATSPPRDLESAGSKPEKPIDCKHAKEIAGFNQVM